MTVIVKKNIPKNARLNNKGKGLGGDVIINNYGGSTVNVVDNLKSTSTKDALSANQGKVLDDKISNIGDTLKDTFISKTVDDTANGKITFTNGLITDSIVSKNIDANNRNGFGIVVGGYNKSRLFINDIESWYTITTPNVFFDNSISSKNSILDEKGFIATKNDDSTVTMQVDNLDVFGNLNVKTLEIEESKWIGGKLYCTLAGITVSKVETFDTYYRVYFINEKDGITIHNKFQVNDLAFCQTFNNNKVKKYWYKVIAVQPNYINLSRKECLSNSAAPEVGDDIIQLGNIRDRKRRGALVLSPDGMEVYEDIKTFEMPTPKIIIAPNNTKIDASTINFLGQTIINNNFQVDEKGNIELNGTIRAEKGYFKGFIEKGITTITPDNVTDYVYFDAPSSSFSFYFDKISPVIIFEGDFSKPTKPYPQGWESSKWRETAKFYLPSIYCSHGYNHKDTVDRARRFINIDMCVYNMATNFAPYFSGSFQNNMNPDGNEDTNPKKCNPNKMYYLHSYLRFYNGKENIYWVFQEGNYEIGY